MSLLNTLENIVKGAAVGVAAVTALPLFGPVGTITAMGVAAASTIGMVVSLVDEIRNGS